MYRPVVTWIIRKKSKTIYCVFALVACSLFVVHHIGSSPTSDALKPYGLDAEQGLPKGYSGYEALPLQLANDSSSSYRGAPAIIGVDTSGPLPEYTRREVIALSACRDKMADDYENWVKDWPNVKDNHHQVPRFQHTPMISTKTKLFYCPVGKVASSFFTRWVLAMNKPGPMTSPYDIAIKDAGRGRAESLTTLPLNQRADFLHNSTRVVFGRNPYSRIFSAYVDKLFSPNPFYWGYWAKQAVLSDGGKFEKCGSNVTFAQFVNHVVKDLAKKDVHLIPVTVECNTCQMRYNVVGKLENTVDDLDYASKLLNISSSFQHQDSYKQAAQKDVILDAVKSAFSWKSPIKTCGVSLDEMGQRMWRKFQIRGVIDSRIMYPLKPGEIDRMTSTTFINVCDRAIKRSTDVARLKKQRKMAMRLAYASVPKDLVVKIKKVYDLDFAYFEYEREADFIQYMNATDLKDNGVIFQWRKPWIVT